jgi:hypothetical protein
VQFDLSRKVDFEKHTEDLSIKADEAALDDLRTETIRRIEESEGAGTTFEFF